VVEGRHQTDAAALEHAIAEDVTGHVADPNDPQGLALGVHAQRPKMPPYRQPGSFGRYGESLVVITVTAPRGERVPEPITPFRADGVGQVGKRAGAFVRGDHEISVVTVPAHHLPRVGHFLVDDVVRHVQQGPDEGAVGVSASSASFRSVSRILVQYEGSLGPGRHDQGVFLDLGPGQAQYLSPQV